MVEGVRGRSQLNSQMATEQRPLLMTIQQVLQLVWMMSAASLSSCTVALAPVKMMMMMKIGNMRMME